MDIIACTCVTVQAKVQMLDNLLDIEVAYSLLRGGAQDNERDPIDINYEKLKTKIEVRSVNYKIMYFFPHCLLRLMFRMVIVWRRLRMEGYCVNLLFHRLLTKLQRRLKSLCNM